MMLRDSYRPIWLLMMGIATWSCAHPATPSGAPCDTDQQCHLGQRCSDGRCGDVADVTLGDAGVRATADGSLAARADAGPCQAVSAESTIESAPVDIIIVIDNSGSMTEEAEQVQTNINLFAEIIARSGLDYRVVLISAEAGDTGVCVPPPLGNGPDGTPSCGSGPEGRLRAIHRNVSSHNALDRMLSTYPEYRDFLRPSATKVFIWITDDESDNHSADSFRRAIQRLEPSEMFANTIHNAIVGYYGETDWGDRGAGACASLADVGTTYLRLSTCVTNEDAPIAGCINGRTARVCETDWRPIFENIAMGVVAGVPISCEFEIPEPPMNQTLDLDEVRVTWLSGDVLRSTLDRVSSADGCTTNGWHLDDPTAPTEIRLCPDLCRTVRADSDARLDIALGCFPFLE